MNNVHWNSEIGDESTAATVILLNSGLNDFPLLDEYEVCKICWSKFFIKLFKFLQLLKFCKLLDNVHWNFQIGNDTTPATIILLISRLNDVPQLDVCEICTIWWSKLSL